jgi:hypothetical protein
MDPASTFSADHLRNETLGLNNLIHESNESSEKLDKFQNELAKKLGMLENELEDKIQDSEVI